MRWELAPIRVDTGTTVTGDPTGPGDATLPGHTTGTRLTPQHSVGGRDWVPKAAAGWHLCLLVAERFLDGHPVDPIRGRAALDRGWASLNEAYAAQLRVPATGLPGDPAQQ